ncbi:MAG: sensor domain-containing diguanylate cyclase [Spirochaetia bacterium]|nr:sensor domain-containing diguanylate cyclase [Spirochaetia bacterium]
MKTPPVPPNEETRLKTLKSLNILDTPAEERFDRLTRMAKRMFDVPIALVSIIDENRQWFKSCVGLTVSETPRDISFCGHAILGDDIFLIPDAIQDERFSDNPLVLNEPHIRFYAGCPLTAPDGSKLGTLCIIDEKPRNFDKQDLLALKDLALTVERELAAIQMATIDELTNILNRRGFMMLARHTLMLFVRQKIPASLVFFDLNNFKSINDNFGHAEGDQALIAFASQMKSVFRESDLFARLGGDEFIGLLSNTSKEIAESIIATLLQLLEKYNQEVHRGYAISFSHGIVDFNPNRHQTVEKLLADGDLLMYKRKKKEKMRV